MQTATATADVWFLYACVRVRGCPQNDPEYVKQLLALMDVSHTVLERCFHGEVLLGRALWKGLETVLNSDTDHAEMLAMHLDTVLRGRLGTLSDTETEKVIEACMNLMRYMVVRVFIGAKCNMSTVAGGAVSVGGAVRCVYLQFKDLFREHYALLLSRRLLQRKSASSDAERFAVVQMKAMCGGQYTDKLERMCQDLALAEDASKAYEAVAKASTAVPVDVFSVSVLQMSAWPAMTMLSDTKLPPVMRACVNHLAGYFRSQNATRQLNWAYAQGSAEVLVKFSDKVLVTVTCGTLQAVVLLVLGAVPKMAVRYVVFFMAGLGCRGSGRVDGAWCGFCVQGHCGRHRLGGQRVEEHFGVHAVCKGFASAEESSGHQDH